MTSFKAQEKLFKQLNSPETAVNKGKAIDFKNGIGYEFVKDVSLLGRSCRLLSLVGFEGTYVIPNCLSRRLQVELAQHCLSDCLQPENKTNLHSHTADICALSSVSVFSALLC